MLSAITSFNCWLTNFKRKDPKNLYLHLEEQVTKVSNAKFLEEDKSENRDWSKSIGEGVGRSREGVGHEVLSLVQGVGRTIFSYP